MMTTPICDFVNEYNKSRPARMHMPGHKGKALLGFEHMDITEISGADSLFEAEGIIAQSEENASSLFGCRTFYSTEGSSLCIRAMLYLLKLWDNDIKILAGRNAHKAFITAAAMTDIDIEWLYPNEADSYLSGRISPESVSNALERNKGKKIAVYITSPDYLGNIADIGAISHVCKKAGALLCVDNAHGAYLKFFPESLHPIDLGADICCDSAHKTLPVITGGAYLHISPDAPEVFTQNAKNALAMFGSTSPSYLILQSLDKANEYLADNYRKKLWDFLDSLRILRRNISNLGYTLIGDEEIKLVFDTKAFGYYGYDIGRILEDKGIFCEFYDKDHLVLMLSPETVEKDMERLLDILSGIPKKTPITKSPPKMDNPKKAMTFRKAVFSKSIVLPVNQCEGRIIAEFNVACPPAVPILVCGEVIDRKAIECFEYYGIDKCKVVEV